MLYSHQVNAQSDGGRDEHNVGVDSVRHVCESFDCQVQQHAGDHPDKKNRREGTQHFGSVPSKWHRLSGWSRGHPYGAKRYHEAGEVREQMWRICRDRQTTRQIPSYPTQYAI